MMKIHKRVDILKTISIIIWLITSANPVVGQVSNQNELAEEDSLLVCMFSRSLKEILGVWSPTSVDTTLEKLTLDLWEQSFGSRSRLSISSHPSGSIGASTFYKKKPFILFNEEDLAKVKTRLSVTKFNAFFTLIMLHEMGHVHGYHITCKKSNPDFEVEADVHMGLHLFKIFEGQVSFDWVDSLFNELCPKATDGFYKGSQGRIEDARRGWLKAGQPRYKSSILNQLEISNQIMAERLVDSNSEFYNGGVMQSYSFGKDRIPLKGDTTLIRKIDPLLKSPILERDTAILANAKIYKFEKDVFQILKEGTEYFLALQQNKTIPKVIGRIVPSNREMFKLMIIDNSYYAWYLSDFSKTYGYRIYSYFDDKVNQPLSVGEINTTEPIHLLNEN